MRRLLSSWPSARGARFGPFGRLLRSSFAQPRSIRWSDSSVIELRIRSILSGASCDVRRYRRRCHLTLAQRGRYGHRTGYPHRDSDPESQSGGRKRAGAHPVATATVPGRGSPHAMPADRRAIVALFLSFSAGRASAPRPALAADHVYRVRDIDPDLAGNPSSAPAEVVVIDGVAFFRATDDHGTELWRSDGTASGTYRLRDINPGPASSDPAELTPVGDRSSSWPTTAPRGRRSGRPTAPPRARCSSATCSSARAAPSPASLVAFEGGHPLPREGRRETRGWSCGAATARSRERFSCATSCPGRTARSPNSWWPREGRSSSPPHRSGPRAVAQRRHLRGNGLGAGRSPGGRVVGHRVPHRRPGQGVLRRRRRHERPRALVERRDRSGHPPRPRNRPRLDGSADRSPWPLSGPPSSSGPAKSATGSELWKSDGTETGTVLVKDLRPGFCLQHSRPSGRRGGRPLLRGPGRRAGA